MNPSMFDEVQYYRMNACDYGRVASNSCIPRTEACSRLRVCTGKIDLGSRNQGNRNRRTETMSTMDIAGSPLKWVLLAKTA
jgi:hypothetical protein